MNLLGFGDYENSLVKKLLHQDKVDPGTFSIFEPGWWALHALGISAVYLVGSSLAHKKHHL